jgi:hypothetical protein
MCGRPLIALSRRGSQRPSAAPELRGQALGHSERVKISQKMPDPSTVPATAKKVGFSRAGEKLAEMMSERQVRARAIRRL